MKRRILNIDDDVAVGVILKLCLESTGQYEVLAEAHPANAIQSAHAFKPDLILLDLIMPGMDGYEVARRLHRDPDLCHVPIIVVSAMVSDFDRSGRGSVVKNGQLMLSKPVRLKDLVLCIEDQLALAT